MNLFSLIFKQMRQRALGTCLTLLSVMLGVGLAVSIMVLRRGSEQLFVQSDFGYQAIVGPPQASPLDLVMNCAYHIGFSKGNVPYAFYEDLIRRTREPGRPFFAQDVKLAVPFMVGDSFKGRRIIGTSPQMFGFDDDAKPLTGYDGHGVRLDSFQDPDAEKIDQAQPVAAATFQFRAGEKYEMAAGRAFKLARFEAVIGSEAAEQLHLNVYDDNLTEEQNQQRGAVFQATHGFPAPDETPDIHKPKWHIVGILRPTRTANDRVLFVPVVSLYAIAEHEKGMMEQKQLQAGNLMHDTAPAVPPPATASSTGDEDEDAYHLDGQGNIVPLLPKQDWEISAILVRTRKGNAYSSFSYVVRVAHPEVQQVNPAEVMRDFFRTFFKNSTLVLMVISALVTVVAAVSILVSIYNSVAARIREIAIIRALGATRGRVLWLICLEAGLVGLLGGIAGLVLGHVVGAVESYFFRQQIGQGINWWSSDWEEWAYLAAVVAVAMLAGLVPAMKAYRTSVASNLVAD